VAVSYEWSTSEITVDLVDQNGNRLENSRIRVYGATGWLPNPLSVVLPITDETVYPTLQGVYKDGYDVRIAPSLNNNAAKMRSVGPLEVSTSPVAVSYEWSTSEITVDLVDQNGNRLENSHIGVYGATGMLPNPLTVVLPITDETIYPTIEGVYKDGYSVRIAPSRNNYTGDWVLLGRWEESLEVSTAPTAVTYEWITTEVTVDLIDQHGNRLENSRIWVYGATHWLPNPLTVVLPITDEAVYPTMEGIRKGGYEVRIAPSLNDQTGNGQYLYRTEIVEASISTLPVEFQWICVDATVNFRDQYGNFSYGTIIGAMSGYAASPFLATLPINSKLVYPTLNGSDSNGYTFKSPEYIGETETVIVSEQTQTIDLVWENPYAPSPELPTTTIGTFAYYLLGEDLDIPLTRQDGTPINPDEVEALYGNPDGFTIYVNGIDICSQEYADLRGWEKPLKPVYQDLSTDWPNPEVREGILAIDPVSGRFALFAGNYPEATMMVETGFAWTGFGVPGIGDIIVVGNYAYLPAGEGNFQVIDVSDKADPRVIGHFGIGFNNWVQVKDSIAYLIQREKILTLDISNPEVPDWLGDNNPAWTSPSGRPMQMQLLNNNYAAVTILNSAIEFYILDLSDPTNITEVSPLDLGETLGGQELFINGNRAYVGIYGRPIWFEPTEGGGVIAIDISDPVNPFILGAYHGEPEDDEYDTPYLIGHDGDMMIMATNWNQVQSKPAKLIVVDMTDPANPRRRGEYVFLDNQDLPEKNVFLKRALCDGGYLYVTNSNYDYTGVGLNRANPPSHLYTFDISDPDNIVMVDDYSQTPAKYRYVSKSGRYLYINDYNYGIRIFDVNDPSKPHYVGGTVTAGEGHWVWANEEGTYAYLAQSFGGSIYAIDITNNAHPQVVGKPYWDGEWLSYTNLLLGKGDILYLPQSYAVTMVDYQDINNPVKIGEVPGVPGPLGMTIQGNYIYINYTSPGANDIKLLGVFDISNPSDPLLISETTLPTINVHTRLPISIENNYAFVTNTKDKKLLILDVSDPALPVLISNFEITEQPEGFQGWYEGNIIACKGYSYVIGKQGGEDGFHIIDVRNPANPSYVSFISTGGWPENFLVYNNLLILGLYSSTHVYDISAPSTPSMIESVHLGGWASWNPGIIRGTNLYYPSLDGLKIMKLPAESQGLIGTITAAANILNYAPVANAGPDQVIEATSSQETMVYLDGSGSSDADGDALTYKWNWAGGSASGVSPGVSLPLGHHEITLIVNDGKEDSAPDMVEVIVQDTTPPVLVTPPSVTVEATGELTLVTLGQASATDIFDVSITNDSPVAFPLGDTTVIWTARDANDNTSTGTQIITVRDTTPPVLTVSEVIIVVAASQLGSSVVIEADAKDLADPSPLINIAGLPIYPIGQTDVIVTATDMSGNSISKTVLVNITYLFSGFLQPINQDNSSIFKAGRTIPVKFQLSALDSSYFANSIATIAAYRITDAVLGTEEELDPEVSGHSNIGTQFRYDEDSQHYIYNLKTKDYSHGTYRIEVILDDGMLYSVNISFK
jgi:hypothetical protein